MGVSRQVKLPDTLKRELHTPTLKRELHTLGDVRGRPRG